MIKTQPAPNNLPPHLNWDDQQLHLEAIPLTKLAKQYQTPCYVYSKAAIVDAFTAYQKALAPRDHLICYAVKANSNLSLLTLLASLGAGFDIVSQGELERCLVAKVPTDKIIFSGVGKTASEIERALECGIYCFNVESAPELQLISDIAANLNKVASIALRVNPDIDAKTHPYIATGMKEHKFGLSVDDALALAKTTAASPQLQLIGLSCHIGSQLLELDPYAKACLEMLALAETLKQQGLELEFINMGGGLGIAEQKPIQQPPSIKSLGELLLRELPGYRLLLEPGRSIIGPAGVLLTKVIRIKQHGDKNFAIVDAAMNDYLRTALYQAAPTIVPLQLPGNGSDPALSYDVVGPVCESADCFARDEQLAIAEGDTLALLNTGAYGFAMSSQYNSRPRPAEVLVDGGEDLLIRERESYADLFARERGISRGTQEKMRCSD